MPAGHKRQRLAAKDLGLSPDSNMLRTAGFKHQDGRWSGVHLGQHYFEEAVSQAQRGDAPVQRTVDHRRMRLPDLVLHIAASRRAAGRAASLKSNCRNSARSSLAVG